MPIQYCEECDKYIDLDQEVEHFDTHKEDDQDTREPLKEQYECR